MTVSVSSQWHAIFVLYPRFVREKCVWIDFGNSPAPLTKVLIDLRYNDVFTAELVARSLERVGAKFTLTHKPRGCISTIRSFTRSPISLIQAFTRSRSLTSGQELFERVEDSNFFMYAFNSSESNLARGDGASESGVGGERRPDALAMAQRMARAMKADRELSNNRYCLVQQIVECDEDFVCAQLL